MSLTQENGKQFGGFDLALPEREVLQDPAVNTFYIEMLVAAQAILAQNLKEAIIIRVQTDEKLREQLREYRFGKDNQPRPDLGSDVLNKSVDQIVSWWIDVDPEAQALYEREVTAFEYENET